MFSLKNYRFWLCFLFCIAFFSAIYPFSVSTYTNAYYALIFNGITAIVIAFTLYKIWNKGLNKKNINSYILMNIISMFPHFILALLSYGSWVCIGISILSVSWLILLKKQLVDKK